MKVAIITSGYLPVPPTRGGAVENIIYNLIKENEIHHACDFIVYSTSDENSEKFKYTEVKQIPTSGMTRISDRALYFIAKNILRKEKLISYRYFFQRIAFLRQVGKDLNVHTVDRVILENNVVMFRAMEYLNNFEKYEGKIYYHAHNELGKTLGYDRYLSRVKRLIGVSDYITTYYQTRVGSHAVKYETLHNAIDEKLFEQKISQDEIKTLKLNLGIDTRYPVLLFVGRTDKEKGILELLKALRGIKEHRYSLLILGSTFYGADIKDSFGEELQEIAKKIRGKILFTGNIPYQQMYKYYQLADLCILPSVWQEPCSMAVIECITSRTPLITTRVGGNPENVSDATILLDTENLVDALREQIQIYLSDPQKLNELKERTKKCTYRHGTLAQYYHSFIRAVDIKE